jgi:cation diffusion facilitator family transporter
MQISLVRYAYLSIGAAIITIILKLTAYWITNSVGLLSDALEAGVNLLAALIVLGAIRVVEKPPDADHEYGHDKAGYLSSGIEGILILLAALTIIIASFRRLLDPQPIEQPGIGLMIALLASAINLLVARTLIRVGKGRDSIILEADGQHLMTDVWTSIGVVLGVSAAVITGVTRIDPLIAILVGAKIGWEGARIVLKSLRGLMDTSIEQQERDVLTELLDRHEVEQGIQWHALRTRQAGARRFVSVHLLVPGDLSVQQAHDLSEQLEAEIRSLIPNSSVFTHIEPVEDPLSAEDITLDRLY